MAYFIAACVLDFQRATALVVLTSLAVAAVSFELLKKHKGKSISRCFRPAVKCFKSNLKWSKWWVVIFFSSGSHYDNSCTLWNLFKSEDVFYCVFRVFVLVVLVLFVVWIVLDTSKRPEQLISFGGVCMFIVLIFLLSAHRTAVSFAVSQSLTLLKCAINVGTTVSKHAWELSHTLSLLR